MKKICVYCGSSLGRSEAYQNTAIVLGKELARQNITLVYGGASVGIMGILADTVLEYGGEVIGVIPKDILAKEVGHNGLTELHIAENMHERKKLMETLSDGFIALPGGMGTLEELFEVLTWGQLGFHHKPIALMNVAGYYDHLIKHMEHSVQESYVRPEHTKMLMIDDDPASLIKQMNDYQPPVVSKWIKDDEI